MMNTKEKFDLFFHPDPPQHFLPLLLPVLAFCFSRSNFLPPVAAVDAEELWAVDPSGLIIEFISF